MTLLEIVQDYDAELLVKIKEVFGEDDPPYYKQELVNALKSDGLTHFYYNVIEHDDPNIPIQIPVGDSLGIMITSGESKRQTSMLIADLYRRVLDGIPPRQKLHTILLFDTKIELQALTKLSDLNSHPAMGTQIIWGTQISGMLKIAKTFVEKITGRRDVLEAPEESFEEVLAMMERHLADYY